VRWPALPLALLTLAVLIPASAFGHAERQSYFPDHTLGKVPKLRTSGPSLVVCKSDSGRRIAKLKGKALKRNRALLQRCKYHHIQAAVNAAHNGYRILVLPGVYKEEPSRRVPNDNPKCKGDEYEGEEAGTKSYKFQRDCPNVQNLIAIGAATTSATFRSRAPGASRRTSRSWAVATGSSRAPS
jgi:hypothetical protein